MRLVFLILIFPLTAAATAGTERVVLRSDISNSSFMWRNSSEVLLTLWALRWFWRCLRPYYYCHKHHWVYFLLLSIFITIYHLLLNPSFAFPSPCHHQSNLPQSRIFPSPYHFLSLHYSTSSFSSLSSPPLLPPQISLLCSPSHLTIPLTFSLHSTMNAVDPWLHFLSSFSSSSPSSSPSELSRRNICMCWMHCTL